MRTTGRQSSVARSAWLGALLLCAACDGAAVEPRGAQQPESGAGSGAAQETPSAGGGYSLVGGDAVAGPDLAHLPGLPDMRRPDPLPVPDPQLPPYGKVFPAVEPPADLATFEGRAVTLERRDYADGKPETVLYRTRDAKGRLVDHGPDLRWHGNGVLALRRTWVLGSLQGLCETWHVGGASESRGLMQADLREGAWETWYETGVPKAVQEHAAGLQHGVSLEWYPDGGRKSRIVRSQGKDHGPYQSWYKNGGMAKDGTMLAGRPDGIWREWTEDGAPKSMGTWLEGREHGAWLRRLDDGAVQREWYDRGTLTGPRTTTSPQGVVLIEERFVAGKLDGLVIERYEDGRTKSEVAYKEGAKQGPAVWYHADGKPWIRGQHLDGKRSGRFVFTNPDGSVDAAWSGLYEDDRRVAP